jgi:predicted O-methyltransferase YrrM
LILGHSLFTLSSYIKYKIRAQNAHGLHSPFLFRFYNEVIKGEDPQLKKSLIEIRNSVFNATDVLSYIDPKSNSHKNEPISRWSKRVTSSLKFTQFLIRLIDFLEVKTVLETGTASGINASSLTYSKAEKIVTLEGSSAIATIASEVIAKFGNDKVRLIEGEIKDTFKQTLMVHQPELIFLDADHRSETINFYLDVIAQMKEAPTCILVHDIYWSKDMYQAWQEIIKNPSYALTMDLFEVGIIFPKIQIEKQHFLIQF